MAPPDEDLADPGGSESRPRVYLLNQYFVPDVASTGHLLGDLSDHLVASGFHVNVLTAWPSYGPRESWQPAPRHEIRNGAHVTRMITTRFSKDHLLGRAVNSLTFILPFGLRMLLAPRDAVYLYTTNPPYLGIVGALVSKVKHHRYVVLLHDAYPQLAVWVGKIRGGGLIERLWHRINRLIYRRADQTIVLCNAAKRLLCESYQLDPDRIHVIPNWADGTELWPKPKRESDLARQHGLVDVFTALYSGNLGLYYDFETLLGAAERLRDEPFRMVLVGAGGRKQWIEQEIRRRGLRNCLMLPYQPFERLNDSLNGCDTSIVTIEKGIEGISFPSKLYTSLAVGKPILALSESDSDLRGIVESNKAGWWTEIGNADALAERLRMMMADRAECERRGANARALFEREYTVEASGARYAEVLRLVADRSPRRTMARAR